MEGTKTVADLLTQRLDRGVLHLTLNRPRSYNALSEEMLGALRAALARIAEDASVRVVVIGGAGKAFCAGHDLRELRAKRDGEYYRKIFQECARLMLDIHAMAQPVIARVHGIATAGGCQLAAACDLVVATSDARFATSGIRLGLFCSTPAVALARSVGEKQAFEMLVTGEFVDAQEALRIGLVNRVAPPEALDAQVRALCDAILANPAHIVAMGKELFYRQQEMGVDAAYQLAAQTMACNLMDAAAGEGIDAFLEKRPAKWSH